MTTRFLVSKNFWIGFCVSFMLFGAITLWETGAFSRIIPSLPRLAITRSEVVFSGLIVVLLAWNTGLLLWQKREGTCPVGTGSATGIAGALGAVSLLCPVCTIIPFSILGTSVSFAVAAPYMPLLRMIALILLLGASIMLWPRTTLQTQTSRRTTRKQE